MVRQACGKRKLVESTAWKFGIWKSAVGEAIAEPRLTLFQSRLRERRPIRLAVPDATCQRACYRAHFALTTL